jgi:hypothetical protein
MVKMKSFLALFLMMLAALPATAGSDRELLREYHGKVVLPADLYRTYAGLVSAFETGKKEEIEKFCLPGRILFSTKPRTSNPDYGQDMNLPFLKNAFNRYILNLRKDSDSEFLIRTGTTALWFKMDDNGRWKLFKYLDKPIM